MESLLKFKGAILGITGSAIVAVALGARGILQFILAKFLAIFLRKLRKDERSIKDGRLRAEYKPHAKNRCKKSRVA